MIRIGRSPARAGAGHPQPKTWAVRSRPGRWHSGHATDGPRADLIVASAHSDADVVASAKDYVDEVEAMFERVLTVNVAEMTATIEQGLSNLEAVIALIPLAVEPPGRA